MFANILPFHLIQAWDPLWADRIHRSSSSHLLTSILKKIELTRAIYFFRLRAGLKPDLIWNKWSDPKKSFQNKAQPIQSKKSDQKFFVLKFALSIVWGLGSMFAYFFFFRSGFDHFDHFVEFCYRFTCAHRKQPTKKVQRIKEKQVGWDVCVWWCASRIFFAVWVRRLNHISLLFAQSQFSHTKHKHKI